MEQDHPTPPHPPSPPPPPGDGEGPRLPWEERQHLGFVAALIATVRLLARTPADAFRRLRPDGDYFSPVLFAVILMWVGAFFLQTWSLLLSSASPSSSPVLESGGVDGTRGDVSWAIVFLGITPILGVIGLFAYAGMIHLTLLLFSAVQQSRFGFAGSLKVVAYASIGSLAAVIPFAGALIGGIVTLVLIVIGIQQVYSTSRDKAVLAAVSIVLVSCVYGSLLGLAIFALRTAVVGMAAAADG